MEELAVTLSCSKLNGQFDKKIRVTTNDPAHANEVLTCKGQILEPLLLKPKRINFGQISSATPPEPKTILITPGDSEVFAPKLVAVDTQGLTATLKEIDPGKRFELQVSVQPPFEGNRLRSEVKLQTGVNEAPIASIPVYASVQPRVHAMPRRVMIPDRRTEDWSQTLRLVWDESLDYKITGATSTDPGLKLELVEGDGPPEVKLTVAKDYDPGTTLSTVDLKTNDPEQPELAVSVVMRRRAPAPRADDGTTSRSQRIPTASRAAPTPEAAGAGKEKADTKPAPQSKPKPAAEIPPE